MFNNKNPFKYINFGELSFSYFSGCVLVCILSGNSVSNLFVIACLNILSIPIFIFSVYFQAAIRRKWCSFCLIILTIIAIEYLILYNLFWLPQVYNLPVGNSILSSMCVFVMPCLALNIIKPYLVRSAESVELKKSFDRLRFDRKIFEALLYDYKNVIPTTDNIAIPLRNNDTLNSLVFVLDPFCKPCSEAFLLIGEILNSNNNINVKVMFSCNDDFHGLNGRIITHMLSIYFENGIEVFIEALSLCFLSKKINYDVLVSSYPTKLNEVFIFEKFTAMRTWYKQARLTSTPVFIVNNYVLPQTYTFSDLKYILINYLLAK